MVNTFPSKTRILRRVQVETETGYSRSTIYLRITQGLPRWTPENRPLIDSPKPATTSKVTETSY